MSLLCNPVNQAHIDDLKDRLSGHLIFAPYDPFDDTNELRVVRKLVGIVRAMDKGVLNLKAVQKSFTEHPIPGFCFERWLREMVEEGIYSDTALKGVA